MMQFSPATVAMFELAERWESDKSVGKDLLLCLINVRKQHSDAYQSFKFMAQGMKKTNQISNLFESINSLYHRTRDILVSIDTAVREGNDTYMEQLLNELEESLVHTDTLSSIMVAEDRKLRMSRFEPVNDYLNACLNVYGENEPAEILTKRQAIIVNFIKLIETESAAYMEIRPQAAHWLPNIEYYIGKIKQGVGAVQIFIDEADRQSLIAGAQAIQKNAAELKAIIDDMHEKNDPLFTFSKINEMELLWIRRYRAKEGVIPAESLNEAIQKAGGVVLEHQIAAEGFAKSFLASHIRDYYKQSLKDAADYEQACFAAMTADDETLVKFKDASESFIASMETIMKYAKEQEQDLSAAPNIKEFCEIIAGVKLGIVPSRIMKRVCQFLSERLTEAENTDDEDLIRFTELQKEALAIVMEYFETRKSVRLPEAIEKLKAATAGIISYYKAKEEAAINVESGGIMCVKCGAMNPAGSTYCTSCNSYLMFGKAFSEANHESIIDISQSEGGDQMPDEVIKKLEEMVTNLVFNSKTPSSPSYLEAKTAETVRPLIANGRQIISDINSRPADAEDELNPEPFLNAAKKYVAGLELIATFDDERDIGKVQSGYEMVMESFNELRDLKTAASQH